MAESQESLARQARWKRAYWAGYHATHVGPGILGSNPYSHESVEATQWFVGRHQYIDDINHTWGQEGKL